jgi:peroxiredoxin
MPENNFYVRRIADLHEKMDGGASTEAWKDVADATRTVLNKPAPDFVVTAPDGRQLTLQDVRAGHRAVLINFWFYGCGACREESPHLTKLYGELKDKGLGALAVDLGDTPQRVSEFVEKFDLHVPVAMSRAAEDHSDIFSRYGVRLYPTTFLIDGDGKVIWRAVGFDEQNITELRKALAKLGVE